MEKIELTLKALDKADDAIESFNKILEAVSRLPCLHHQKQAIIDAMVHVVAKVTEYKTLRDLTKQP